MVIEDPEARMTFFIISAFVGFITPFVMPNLNANAFYSFQMYHTTKKLKT